MRRSLLRNVIAPALTIWIVGCSAPLHEKISRIVLHSNEEELHSAAKIKNLKLKMNVVISYPGKTSPGVVLWVYKCNGDILQDRLFFYPILVGDGKDLSVSLSMKETINSGLHSYDLTSHPFDVCVTLLQPEFPVSRKSNLLVIKAQEILHLINEGGLVVVD